MRYIHITTPVARFTVDCSVFHDTEDMADWLETYAARNTEHHIEACVEHQVHAENTESLIEFESGPEGIVPAIWTHTPVPLGMAIEAINKRFEERAATVLGDADYTVEFRKHLPGYIHGFEDSRYYDEALRMAWMMYVDLAIEHYLTPL